MLARRYGVNPKTVRKWRRRESADDRPMGTRERRSSVLSELEEAAVVAFRVQTRRPLDDVVVALTPSVPALTRSTLHRCLQRRGVSQLPRAPKQRRRRFKAYEIGYFHVDIAELRIAREKAYLFLAVDRTSKLAFARVYRRATSLVAAAFLKVLARSVPYRIHTALTDNGIQFGDAGGRRVLPKSHPFDRMCRLLGIQHRITKPYHPWTNGQAERMNRTIKDATVRRYYYDTHDQLRSHLQPFLPVLDAYN